MDTTHRDLFGQEAPEIATIRQNFKSAIAFLAGFHSDVFSNADAAEKYINDNAHLFEDD